MQETISLWHNGFRLTSKIHLAGGTDGFYAHYHSQSPEAQAHSALGTQNPPQSRLSALSHHPAVGARASSRSDCGTVGLSCVHRVPHAPSLSARGGKQFAGEKESGTPAQTECPASPSLG